MKNEEEESAYCVKKTYHNVASRPCWCVFWVSAVRSGGMSVSLLLKFFAAISVKPLTTYHKWKLEMLFYIVFWDRHPRIMMTNKKPHLSLEAKKCDHSVSVWPTETQQIWRICLFIQNISKNMHRVKNLRRPTEGNKHVPLKWLTWDSTLWPFRRLPNWWHFLVAGSHSACSAGSESVVMVWWVLTDSCLAGRQMPGDKCKKWRADWRVQREA